jgi:hypothetical protein
MTDEIVTNPPASKESDAHDVIDQTTSAISQGVVGGNLSDADKVASSNNKLEHADVHHVAHSHFRWHADAIVDGHDICHGMVKDVSIKGANFLVEHNFQNSKLIKLHVHIPPLVVTAPQHVIEVSGKITSTVYDGVEDSFRSAISFVEFTVPSDRALLESRIAGE